MKNKGDRSSVLHEGRKSPPRAALGVCRAAGSEVAQERAQTAVPCLHVEQLLTSQQLQLHKWPAELTLFMFPKRGKSILEVWDTYLGPTARLWRETHTCASCVTPDSSPRVTSFHAWGSFLISQRAISEGWRKAALCLHCHEPAGSRTNTVAKLVFCLQELGGPVQSKHAQNNC